ncbi:MAG: HIT domain-containing protein [Chloroflexota bacterium]|nr:HIT domain-containing protein [Chloroflexota bacterium]
MPTRVLVVPRRQLPSPREADDPALLGAPLATAREVAESEGIGRSGYRVVLNTGPDGGPEVPHLHRHVLGGRRPGPGPPQQ